MGRGGGRVGRSDFGRIELEASSHAGMPHGPSGWKRMGKGGETMKQQEQRRTRMRTTWNHRGGAARACWPKKSEDGQS
eukprot:2213489-Pyramimonas_sp.AAC.1